VRRGSDRGMETTRFLEVAGQGDRCGGSFPLRLGRQPGPGPAGEGVGLVVADMTDRLLQTHPPVPCQGALGPGAACQLPIERRRPTACLPCGPAVGEPELGTLVAAVTHEFQILAVRYQAIGELKTVHERAVSGRLVVESELLSLVSQPGDALRE